jgi:hypothetical protein
MSWAGSACPHLPPVSPCPVNGLLPRTGRPIHSPFTALGCPLRAVREIAGQARETGAVFFQVAWPHSCALGTTAGTPEGLVALGHGPFPGRP